MGKIFKNKKSGSCSLCKPHKHKKADKLKRRVRDFYSRTDREITEVSRSNPLLTTLLAHRLGLKSVAKKGETALNTNLLTFHEPMDTLSQRGNVYPLTPETSVAYKEEEFKWKP